MIKLEHVVLASPEQMGFIIEGMRNPMNSWEIFQKFAKISCYIMRNRQLYAKPMVGTEGVSRFESYTVSFTFFLFEMNLQKLFFIPS